MTAMRCPGPGVEQSQVVVDFRDCRNGTSSPRHPRLLINGQGGREAIHRIDIRTRNLVEKLSRVGGQAVDVLPLTLCVKRVKRERTLPGPGHPRDDGEGITRDIDIDVLKIVDTGAPNADRIGDRSRFFSIGALSDQQVSRCRTWAAGYTV